MFCIFGSILKVTTEFIHSTFLCIVGSSTACIVVLDRRSHQLHTCNLGDSGFLVVRGGEVVHRSDEQQHYFNTPFQLSIAPPGAEGVVLSDRSVAQFWIHLCKSGLLDSVCRINKTCYGVALEAKSGYTSS